MSSRRILLTNICFARRSGTEIMTKELAVALRERGHMVAIYTPTPGRLAQEAMALGVPVADRIEQIGFTPDIIHGHHNVALAPALLRWPDVPAIFVCHDSATPYDRAIVLDRIGAYVGIDQACCQRLLLDGVPEARLRLVSNAVDLRRFRQRRDWAARPLRALAVTKANAPYLDALRAACAAADIALDVVGPAVDNTLADLVRPMLQADIVFAMARSAMEAAATGAAVVICDEHGFGGLLRRAAAEAWPDTALSRRTLREVPTEDALAEAIAAYDAAEARAVSDLVREHLSLDRCAAAFEDIYTAVMDAHATADGSGAALDAARLAGFVAAALPGFGEPSRLEAMAEAQQRRREDVGHWFTLNRPGYARAATEISFARTGAGRLLLGEGWSEPETWGVWSAETEADLHLPAALLRAWNGDIAVSCCHWFARTAADQARCVVDVFSGQSLLASWSFCKTTDCQLNFGWRRLRVPIAGIGTEDAPAAEMRLRLRMRGADSPLALGESGDRRRLGLALEKLVPLSRLLT